MRTLITGSSKGIGRAIALRLSVPGARLALAASRAGDDLDATVREARARGATAVPIVGDLGFPDVPAEIAREAIKTIGGLDTVVSNAGISIPTSLVDTNLSDWDRIFAVNVRAAFLLAHAGYEELKTSKGSFIAIASMSGVQPYPGMGAYSASKAALIMLIRQLAQEWAGDAIRVNAISPGLFHTALTEKIYADEGMKRKRESLVPTRRIGNPDKDIAGMVEFLINSKSDYLTGQNIVIDGGLIDSIQSCIAGRPATGS